MKYRVIGRVTGRVADSYEFTFDQKVVGLNLKSCTVYPLSTSNPWIRMEIEISKDDSVLNEYKVIQIFKCEYISHKNNNTIPRGRTYYKMLCLFSEKVLMSKSTESLAHMYKRIRENPLSFCFHANPKCFIARNRERAFGANDDFWNMNDLAAAARLQIFQWSKYPKPLIRPALDIYHDYCSLLYNWGLYSMRIKKEYNEDAIKFILEHEFLIYPKYGESIVACDCLISKEYNSAENQFIDLIKSLKVVVYSCPLYDGDVFLNYLIYFLSSLHEESDETLFVSANKITAAYMTSLVAEMEEFKSIDDILGSTKRPLENAHTRIVVDRAHRIGISKYIELLSMYPNCTHLYLIGDVRDNQALPCRGGGSILQDMSDVVEWNEDETSSLLKIYRGILKGVPNEHNHIILDKNDDIVSEIIQRSTMSKITNYYIACSDTDDWKNLVRQHNKLMGKPLDENMYMINSQIFVPNLDLYDQIESATCCIGQKQGHVKIKAIIEPKKYSYQLTLANSKMTISTKMYQIENAEIINTKKNMPPPRDCLYFVVTKKTKFIDLLSAIKLSTDRVVLVLTDGVPFNFLLKLKDNAIRPSKTNISLKMYK